MLDVSSLKNFTNCNEPSKIDVNRILREAAEAGRMEATFPSVDEVEDFLNRLPPDHDFKIEETERGLCISWASEHTCKLL